MSDHPTSAAEAERQADAIRHELAETLDQLKDNLQPSHLASEVAARTREHTPDWLIQYWALARSPIGISVIGIATGFATGMATKGRLRNMLADGRRRGAATKSRPHGMAIKRRWR